MNNQFFLVLILSILFCTPSCQKEDNTSVSSKEEFEAKIKSEFSEQEITSISYCIVKNDKVLYSNALGYANKSNNTLATDSTRYLVASVSKTITAVAIMKLVEQNLISLDDDINQFLPYSVRNPSFPNDKITYRMLLSHTSSIVDDFQENFDLDCYGIDCTMTLEQYFNHVFLNSGQYYSSDNFSSDRPGTYEAYSNLGSALLGYLVERITNTPFDTYCKNNIFIPLNMKKTEWRLANTPIAELAVPYSPEITNPNPHYTFPDYPNGGLRTNVLDLSIFLRTIILNGTFNGTQILSPSSMNAMKALQFGSNEQCLSFYYETIGGKTLLGHSGGVKGVTADMYYDTNTNIGIIVFSNDEDAPLDNIISLMINYAETL
ncbi:MAG: serine hydrolase domain-containing protein [Saprospiraceae bacterium]|nr:serine hydrolase domain-containing protein [Saprospiraceae bacterium]